MRPPVARPIDAGTTTEGIARPPRAFAPEQAVTLAEANPFATTDTPPAALPPRRRSRLGRIAVAAVGVLISLGLGLAADRLIRDLYAANPWLGWLALGVAAVAIVAIVALVIREYFAVRSLRVLDRLRREAADVLVTDRGADGRAVAHAVEAVYRDRLELSAARARVTYEVSDLIDGGDMVRLAERAVLSPLDARARSLTAAAARRVALVTTVSPRALVDIAFVVYESVRLGGAIARLYGARPGFLGTWRLFGAILGHLAVTGGLVLTDGMVEQLVGQGLAARVSARLGEGVVNGLMTVRVGIAAMRVTRPLPFAALPQPTVRDFLPELANLGTKPPA